MFFQPDKIHRIMLKISGEILAGPQGYGFDDGIIDQLTDEIIQVHQKGYKIALVLGGGNIFRGATWKNQSLNRVLLDHIGMLATIQNSLYLAEILNQKKCPARAFSCLAMDNITELYTPHKASEALERGEICFISGGTGNPFFTTDTAAILRAAELGLDLVLKGTKVDGLYTADPQVDPNAQFISSASYDQCLEQKLRVMDMTAFSLAQENRIPLKIFNLTKTGGIEMALSNPDYGTYIYA
ncbi:MAG: UMP kinase [Candidatus Cloacimonetes bacterium]|jgi:uridylate kinase|nr:UMP kinase [Candidatus Cloacimonadota bacterium]